MNHGRLFSAGVIGGVAFSIASSIFRAAGIHIELELWLGTLLIGPGAAAWLVGFFWHVTLSGFIAIAYGRAFMALRRSNVSTGVRLSIVHMVLTGMLVGVVPLLHPRIPEVMPAPGFFLTADGLAGVIALIAVHLAYGAVVGALAEAVGVRAPAPRRSRVFNTSSSPRPSREVAAL